ncbi:hypothetical protein SOPP22_14890 [Shewanella sp. OPT22]|nr:hypothetical protein SOPP22_14890 [Shewanella sp. OPT22]
MPISHKHRVYIPTSARSNQYITADIKVTPELIQHFGGLENLYKHLNPTIFKLAEDEGLHNCQVIANDKLPVIRYHTESYHFQTKEQIIFFYNPSYHEAQNVFIDKGHQPNKIRIVLLATGENLRANSASFHSQVQCFVTKLQQQYKDVDLRIKFRDHQHLSYDLFAKSKGFKESYGFKLRSIAERYRSRDCTLPNEHSSLAYVTVNLPINRKLKNTLMNGESVLSNLYDTIQDHYLTAIETKSLTRTAMIANGRTPLVRNSKFDQQEKTEELQMIGFDPESKDLQFVYECDVDGTADCINFIIVAGSDDCEREGYGKFMNKVEKVFKKLTKQLKIDEEHEDMIVRFHQHISYSK